MRPSRSLRLLLPLLFASAAVAAQAPSKATIGFDADYERAIATGTTKAGLAYDTSLGKYLESLPGFRPGFNKCLALEPGRKQFKGFFRFNVDGSYRLVLRPVTKFSQCMVKVLEGHDPPKPPTLPYYNPIDYDSGAK